MSKAARDVWEAKSGESYKGPGNNNRARVCTQGPSLLSFNITADYCLAIAYFHSVVTFVVLFSSLSHLLGTLFINNDAGRSCGII